MKALNRRLLFSRNYCRRCADLVAHYSVIFGRMNPKKDRGTCTFDGCSNSIKKNATRFCSMRCHRLSEYRRRESVFLSGGYPPLLNMVASLRRYLVAVHGERCTRCGWDERNPLTGRVPIEIEHVDGNWRNNRPDNLTLLCPNCHSLTSTYKGLNRGRGRAYRMARYHGPT